MEDFMANKYKRVLVKLSGEALQDKQNSAILDSNKLNEVAVAIKDMVDQGVEVCIVVGAGNIWRGRLAETIGIDRSEADYMGMLGTIINAVAVKASLINNGLDAQVLSAIEVKQLAKQFTKERALKALNKGKVLIFAGGTGNPYFTTDTCAALRANEVGCDAILMAKNGVEGVYSDDPRKNPNAEFYSKLTYTEMLAKNLSVMDNAALSLCINTNIELRVFNMADMKNFGRVIAGENIGTTITKGE
jgi:uridylate kinase